MKKKMSAVLMFTLSAFLLTSCSDFFSGLLAKLGIGGSDETQVTSDDIPTLNSRTSWEKPYSTKKYDRMEKFYSNDNTIEEYYLDTKLYLYDNGFTAFKALKQITDLGAKVESRRAYHVEGETNMYWPDETSGGTWTHVSDPNLEMYRGFFDEFYSPQLTAHEDDFIYWYDAFVTLASESGMAEQRSTYESLYPGADFTITLTKKNNVFYLKEKVEPTRNSSGDSLIKEQYLIINDGRPMRFGYNNVLTTKSEVRTIDFDIIFEYQSTLPPYSGPFNSNA